MAKFLRVNGVALHYADDGPRHARAIVFANSLGCDFRIWDGVVARLSGYRLIRYDKRGHGLSEATPAPYAMDDHIADVAALMDHMKVSNAILVGISVGGMIAQGLAAARPDLVARLVLCDTAAKIGTRDMWNERIAAVRENGIASIAPGILEKWFTPGFRQPDNADFTGYTAMLTRTPVEGYAGTAAAIRDADFTVSTGRLKLPTLVLVGDQDGSTPPALVRATAELIAGARFEIVADAGHLPCIERADETARLIAGLAEG